ncbi:FmdB family zinc ribbon protein [Pelolinea submarina]|uniref:Putative FmdB family regulatory protein n=1 Tax=Pelolinea submarina TaxID=913107 RepID=A0A3E0A8A4_9CHLR|nr:FmdB family zinc ribbon protein [Pelolinea submarina]REG07154.1 putative FmdB family regulatory protein [Pelolinea submarina]
MIIIENLPIQPEAGVPAYEYICDKCHQSFSLHISYAQYGHVAAACPHCGSEKVTRRIGKVRVSRSDDSRMQQFTDLADERKMEDIDKNPAEIGRMMRQMSQESGAEMGEEFNEVVDRLEHGQTSADLENDLPDPE